MLSDRIETQRLVIRTIVPDDAPALFDICSRPDTAYWAGMEPMRMLSDADDSIFWDSIGLEKSYGITQRGSDTVIGQIAVEGDPLPDGVTVFTIGYLLSPDDRGKGIMTEAVKAVCGEIFRNTDAGYILCEIRKDNLPSRNVASRCGFVQDPGQSFWRLNHYGKPLDRFILERLSC